MAVPQWQMDAWLQSLEYHEQYIAGYNSGEPPPAWHRDEDGDEEENRTNAEWGWADGCSDAQHGYDAPYNNSLRQVEELKVKIGQAAQKGKFHNEDGTFDDMAFRQHCLVLAQQYRPMGNGGVIGNVGQQGPEPIGEVLRRAQMFERYLKDGEVIVPQGNNAMAA